MAAYSNTRTDDKSSHMSHEATDKAKQSAKESGERMSSHTADAFNQFREHDNPVRGYEAFWEKLPTNYYFLASFGSILLSAMLFISGKQKAATFVGLWPPTIINLALMAKQLKPSQEV